MAGAGETEAQDLDALPDAPWFRAQRAEARARDQRLTLWLRGSPQWTAASARRIVAALPEIEPVCLAERRLINAPSRPLRAATALLGQDLDLLILDVQGGFDPDGFGAATGALRGGGLLVLLTPPVAEWACRPDPQAERIAVWPFKAAELSRRFIARLITVLESDPDVVRIDQHQDRRALPRPLRQPDRPVSRPRPDLIHPATPDQALAVSAILKTAHGRARRPLVLTAHRGRGKSAALGLAAGRLLAEGQRRLVVTAPRRESVETLYRHAQAVLSAAGQGTDQRHDASTVLQALVFHSPAEMLEQRPEADLLLVDEAAGIPAPLLTALLEHYGRIVFASTVHGYEGTGRGFEIRFRETLERLTPNWRAMTLDTPIRWAPEDPLERLVFRALLLDAAPAPGETILASLAADPSAVSADWLDRDALLDDAPTLHELFGLLVLAHYQTRPLDLRMLLDGPNVRVLVLRRAGHLLGTLLIAEEGGMRDPELQTAIFRGQRRPRGHLLPQTLSAHAGLLDAPRYRYWRVIRIVVHPSVTGRGLGRRLLRELEHAARRVRVDLLGASFGATTELLEFWRACGFLPAQIGSHRNAASGEHAAVVLRALSDQGESLRTKALRRLGVSLPVWLAGPLRALDPAIAAMLLATLPEPDTAAVESESGAAVTDRRLELDAFVAGHRTLESSLPLLAELTRQRLGEALSAGRITPEASALLVAVSVQFQPLASLAHRFEARGREALLRRLRQVCGQLIDGP